MSVRYGYRTAAFAGRVGWLMLPVIMAGLAHVVVLKTDVLRRLALPIDGGKQWRTRPLLGSNKTWRGLLLMSACTAGFTHLQSLVGRQGHDDLFSVWRDYRVGPWLAGSIMGLSYCLAELPNSFIKRRLGIPPGARSAHAAPVQYVVDQTDSVIGCLVALRTFYRPRRGEVVLAFVLGSAIHIGVDRLLHVIGVKRQNS